MMKGQHLTDVFCLSQPTLFSRKRWGMANASNNFQWLFFKLDIVKHDIRFQKHTLNYLLKIFKVVKTCSKHSYSLNFPTFNISCLSSCYLNMHALVVFNSFKNNPSAWFCCPHNKVQLQTQRFHNCLIYPHEIIGGKWLVEKGF